MDEPIIIDSELECQHVAEKTIKTSRYASSEEEKTPPAAKNIRAPMIGLNTPKSPSPPAALDAKPLDEAVPEISLPIPVEESNIFADPPSRMVGEKVVKEKKEMLKYIDDVFSEDPMIVSQYLISSTSTLDFGIKS